MVSNGDFVDKEAFKTFAGMKVLVFGLGIILATLIGAILCAVLFKWPKHKKVHKPDDEHLLT